MPGADEHRAHARVGAGAVAASHVDDIGEEVGAGRALLGEDLVAAVAAVVADRRRGHEHARLAFPARDRARDQSGAALAAVTDLLLLLVGPAMLGDALAGQVHDRVDTFERGRIDASRPAGSQPMSSPCVTPPRWSRSTR